MSDYREQIILTYRALINIHQELSDRIINVGMLGEFDEINEVFKLGETYDFNIDQFRGTGDANLNLLLKMLDELEEVMNSMANINGITEDELEDDSI
jgi:hypothetical protein